MIGDGDFGVFFNPEEFGEVATVERADGTTFDVPCQFFLKGVSQSLFGEVTNGFAPQARVVGNATTLYAATEIVAEAKAGKVKVQVRGVTYSVSDNTSDGTGMSTLKLVRA